MAALRPILRERAATEIDVTMEGEGATVTALGEQYRIETPGPMAALLFGGNTEEARAIPPVGGPLGRLLERLCPIPLLRQGCNYV